MLLEPCLQLGLGDHVIVYDGGDLVQRLGVDRGPDHAGLKREYNKDCIKQVSAQLSGRERVKDHR